MVGKDPFGTILDATMANKTVRGRTIRVVRYADVTRLVQAGETVQVLYVGAGDKSQLDAAIRAVAGTNALTVGESPDFCDQGGVIGFRTLDNRVRFDVNLDAAKRAGLTVSSQLLKLANAVKGAPQYGGTP